MTVQPAEFEQSSWPARPRRGCTVEDVLNLPDDSPTVELVDGVMLVVPSPMLFHQDVASLLRAWLRAHAPSHFQAAQAVGVLIDAQNTREPDVLLLDADVNDRNHFFQPGEVTLVVEVVSPSTRRQDRLEKPAVYAKAGIQHYWRVELEPQVHVYAYERQHDGLYALVADNATELTLARPFPLTLPIAAITP